MQIDEKQARAILEVFEAHNLEERYFSPESAKVLFLIFLNFPPLKKDFSSLATDIYLQDQYMQQRNITSAP